MVGNSTDDTVGPNKALLLIPTANLPLALWNGGNGEGTSGAVRKGMIYLDLEEVETTGIEGPQVGQRVISTDSQQGYYTLSGIKLSGKPTQKGIYVHNGKKVSIK